MTLKEILDETLRSIPESELVFIRTRDKGLWYNLNEPRDYLLRWGGFQQDENGKDNPYSEDGSKAHLYSIGPIFMLLYDPPCSRPTQKQLAPPDEKGRYYFTLSSIPEELVSGKDAILKVLGKHQLQHQSDFVEKF